MKQPISRKHSKRELAEASIFPHGLSAKEKQEADKELLSLRKEQWNKRSGKDQLRDELLQLKYQIEDVIDSPIYRSEFHYGYFLATYIRLLRKNRKILRRKLALTKPG